MQRKIFFIGIGGKGLNGIAKICLELGYQVSGVDSVKKEETIELEKMGACVFYDHNKSNLNRSSDLVVYSSITDNSPELLHARELGIRTLKRAEFLKFLTQNDFRICIAGSHGKSTTTALVGLNMIHANTDPTIFGGAYTKELKSYNRLGKSKYSVIEACEYDRSFHHLIGNITILTSLEKSHLEYYEDEEEMNNSFKYFLESHSKDAILILNGDNSTIRKISKKASANVVFFGFRPENDYVIKNVIKNKIGSTFSIYKGNELIVENLKINIPGNYNVLNFAASAILLHKLDLNVSSVFETAKHFSGVGRRFEIFETANDGPIFVDDFAHHPTQVKNLFDGIKQFFPTSKTCAVFQPRQYNLMRNFKDEYGQAFEKADEIILTDIIPSLGDTDEDVKSISSEDLVDSIKQHSGKPVRVINNFSEIVNYIKENYFSADSVVTTIGAGDIYKIREYFMNLAQKGNLRDSNLRAGLNV
jgi:UDP-N-acetylmuramate--alanine ligase